jgi:hypothetical protein
MIQACGFSFLHIFAKKMSGRKRYIKSHTMLEMCGFDLTLKTGEVSFVHNHLPNLRYFLK